MLGLFLLPVLALLVLSAAGQPDLRGAHGRGRERTEGGKVSPGLWRHNWPWASQGSRVTRKGMLMSLCLRPRPLLSPSLLLPTSSGAPGSLIGGKFYRCSCMWQGLLTTRSSLSVASPSALQRSGLAHLPSTPGWIFSCAFNTQGTIWVTSPCNDAFQGHFQRVLPHPGPSFVHCPWELSTSKSPCSPPFSGPRSLPA